MEIIKDLFGAVSRRLRSHFFGSILLSFIVINWKPIYYFLYSDTTIWAKFIYVDGTLKLWEPLGIGVVIAAAAPFVALVGAWVASFPTAKLKSLQDRAASNRIKEKIDLEAEENEARARAAQAVDSTIGEIEDEGVRDKFRSDVLSENGPAPKLRMKDIDAILQQLTPECKYLLKRMEASGSGILTITGNLGNEVIEIGGQRLKDKEFSIYELAISDLEAWELVRSVLKHSKTQKIYKLTQFGLGTAEGLIMLDQGEAH